ncbi:glycosyltransferase family 2 protein [Poriferisphaera sp. WC338]|uniref:glycosyltransferase family 2 protein n=1 Tax=Poriferisphaera sp. WC338 TaxID=3425129 RepID=UPI003D8149D1
MTHSPESRPNARAEDTSRLPAPLDIIIPAYNESENIPALAAALQALSAAHPDLLRRIILVDNHSSDDTPALAAAHNFTVLHQPVRGYGSACLAAINYLTSLPPQDQPRIVAFLDADLSDDPANIPHIITPILQDRADFVIAQRDKHADPGALNSTQRFGSRLAATLINLTTRSIYTDLGPLRAITFPALLSLDMSDPTWGWTVEMQYKAAKSKLRTLQIDLPYHNRNAGTSKISGSIIGSVRAGYKIITTIFKLILTYKPK